MLYQSDLVIKIQIWFDIKGFGRDFCVRCNMWSEVNVLCALLMKEEVKVTENVGFNGLHLVGVSWNLLLRNLVRLCEVHISYVL